MKDLNLLKSTLSSAFPNVSVHFLKDEEMQRRFNLQYQPSYEQEINLFNYNSFDTDVESQSDVEAVAMSEEDKGLRQNFDFNESEPREELEDNTEEEISRDKITDFGEKIGGSRKEIWQKNYDKIIESWYSKSDFELLKLPLKTLLPELNYKKVLEQNPTFPKLILATLKILYASVSEKPRYSSYNFALQKNWLENVKLLKDIYIKLYDSDFDIYELLVDGENERKNLVTSAIADIINTRAVNDYSLGTAINLLIENEFWNKKIDNSVFNHNKYCFLEVKEKKEYAIAEFSKYGVLTKFIDKDFDLVINKYKTMLQEAISDSNAKTTQKQKQKAPLKFIVKYYNPNNAFVEGKRGSKTAVLIEGITLEQAKNYRDNKEHWEMLTELFEQKTASVIERQGENEERTGKRYTDDDVTPEMYQNTFGFRGVEFGNYLNQKDRQRMLNLSYEAFMDLATVLQIPPKALSLNGTLAMAFGARGKGGKNSALAHYEPSNKVINLTKLKGAGSLAHEWFHAFDNYMTSVNNYQSINDRKNIYSTQYIHSEALLELDRNLPYKMIRELISSFKNETEISKRSYNADSNREYFKTNVEMSARAFEFYVKEKLKDKGIKNDFLVNFLSENEVEASKIYPMDKYPYPLVKEKDVIIERFDNLFDSIETSVKENNIMLYRADEKRVLGNTDLSTNTIYFNEDFLNENTLVHEYAHIWLEMLENQNPALYSVGMELLENDGREYIEAVKSNPIYQNLTERQIRKEALVTAIGDRGAKIVREEKKTKFKNFLNKVKNFIGVNFFGQKKEKIETLTFDEFLDASVYDLLQGKVVNLNQSSELNKEKIIPILTENEVYQSAWNTTRKLSELNDDVKDKVLATVQSLQNEINENINKANDVLLNETTVSKVDLLKHNIIVDDDYNTYYHLGGVERSKNSFANFLDYASVYPNVDESNYFEATRATFNRIYPQEYDNIDVEEHRSPKSSSTYKIKDGILYRKADHWGNFATVSWSITKVKEWELQGQSKKVFYGKTPISEMKRIKGELFLDVLPLDINLKNQPNFHLVTPKTVSDDLKTIIANQYLGISIDKNIEYINQLLNNPIVIRTDLKEQIDEDTTITKGFVPLYTLQRKLYTDSYDHIFTNETVESTDLEEILNEFPKLYNDTSGYGDVFGQQANYEADFLTEIRVSYILVDINEDGEVIEEYFSDVYHSGNVNWLHEYTIEGSDETVKDYIDRNHFPDVDTPVIEATNHYKSNSLDLMEDIEINKNFYDDVFSKPFSIDGYEVEFRMKYNQGYTGKYTRLNVYFKDEALLNEEVDSYIGDYELRVADHTQNRNRAGKFGTFLSVVIGENLVGRYATDEDRELYFDTDSTYDEVIESVREQIQYHLDNYWVLPIEITNHLNSEFSKEKIEAIELIKNNSNELDNLPEHLRNDREVVLEAVKQNGFLLQFTSNDTKNNKEIVLEAVKSNSLSLQHASAELRNDREVVLEAVKENGYALEYASEELRNDKEIVLIAVKYIGYALEYASEELRNDREVILGAVKENGYMLEYASKRLQNDREVVLEAVKENGEALEYASEELRNDKEIVLEAVKQYPTMIDFASNELKKDKDLALEAVKLDGIALQYLSDTLKNDKNICRLAIESEIEYLQYASKEILSDKEFMTEIIRKNGKALYFASAEFKNDKEIVMQAVLQDGFNLDYASSRLKDDKDLALEAFNKKGTGTLLFSLSKNLKNDKEVVLKAVNSNCYALEYASEELRNDREVVLEAVKENGYVLQIVPNEYKKDKQVVLEAVKSNPISIQFASEELRNDREVVLEAIKTKKYALDYASAKLCDDREIVLEAVKNLGLALANSGLKFRNDREVVLEAVKNYGRSLQYASDELKNDREVVLEAIKSDSIALQYASEKLRNEIKSNKILNMDTLKQLAEKVLGYNAFKFTIENLDDRKEVTRMIEEKEVTEITSLNSNDWNKVANLWEQELINKTELSTFKTESDIQYEIQQAKENATKINNEEITHNLAYEIMVAIDGIIMNHNSSEALHIIESAKLLADNKKLNPSDYLNTLLKNEIEFLATRIKIHGNPAEYVYIDKYSKMKRLNQMNDKEISNEILNIIFIDNNLSLNEKAYLYMLISEKLEITGNIGFDTKEFLDNTDISQNEIAKVEKLIQEIEDRYSIIPVGEYEDPKFISSLSETLHQIDYNEDYNASRIEIQNFLNSLSKKTHQNLNKLDEHLSNQNTLYSHDLADEFETNIPRNMRYKDYEILENKELYWVTHEHFTESDLKQFQKELLNFGFEKAYITRRDFSSLSFEKDLESNVFAIVTSEEIDMSGYHQELQNNGIEIEENDDLKQELEPQTISQEKSTLSFWDKNITPLTNKYKNFIKEMENTPSEIFYRDGKREFTEQEKKFMEIYKYKENSNISETATILNKIESDSSFFQELPEELKQNKNFVYEAVSRNITTLQFVSDEFKNDKDFILEVLQQKGIALEYASAELRNNKEVVLEAVKTDGFALEYVSNELKNDREVVLEAVKSNGFALRFASDELRNDKEIALEAVKQNKRNLQYVSDELKNDKDFILEVLQQKGIALEYASAELRNNKEVVLEAVKQNGFALRFASTELQNDKSLALEAVKQNGLVLQYLPEDLLNDRELVLEAVKQNGFVLQFASDELRNDKEVILETVRNTGLALEYASPEFKDKKSLVLEVVKQNGFALYSVSAELRNDREVVLEAVKQNGAALEYVSKELRNDKEIAIEAMKRNGYALQYASAELRNDIEVVLEAVKQNGVALEFASEELRNDKNVVLEAVSENGYALEYASVDFQNDEEMVLEAIKSTGYALRFASEELRNNRELVIEAMKRNGVVLEYASAELRNDKEVVFEAVKQNGVALEFASEELRNDIVYILQILKYVPEILKFVSENIQKEAVRQNEMALEYASEELRNDREFILEVVKQNSIAFKFASEELHNDKEFVQEAVKTNGYALEFASDEFKNDKEIVMQAVLQDGFNLYYASSRLKDDKDLALEAFNKKEKGTFLFSLSNNLKNDKEVVLKAVNSDGFALEFASEELKNDREVVLEAVKSDSFALRFASTELQNDKSLALEAVKQNGLVLQYLPEELRNDREVELEAVKQNGKVLEFASEGIEKISVHNPFEGNEIDFFVEKSIISDLEKLKTNVESLQEVGVKNLKIAEVFHQVDSELDVDWLSKRNFNIKEIKYNLSDDIRDWKMEQVNSENLNSLSTTKSELFISTDYLLEIIKDKSILFPYLAKNDETILFIEPNNVSEINSTINEILDINLKENKKMETDIILKGGKQEIDLLLKAIDYYNTITVKQWYINDTTIDLTLRHSGKDGYFELKEKNEYSINDILAKLENQANKKISNNEISNINPNFEADFKNAYDKYTASAISKQNVDEISKKENIYADSKNTKMEKSDSIQTYYANYQIDNTKPFTHKDVYAFLTQSGKNELTSFLKENLPEFEMPKTLKKDDVLNHIVYPIRKLSEVQVAELKTKMNDFCNKEISTTQIKDATEEINWNEYYQKLRDNIDVNKPISHQDVYAFINSNISDSLKKKIFETALPEKSQDFVAKMNFSNNYSKTEILANIVYPVREADLSKEIKTQFDIAYKQKATEQKAEASATKKYTQEEFDSYYEKFTLNFDKTKPINHTMVFAYVNNANIPSEEKMQVLNNFYKEVHQNTNLDIDKPFVDNPNELSKLNKNKILAELVYPLRNDESSLEDTFKHHLAESFIEARMKNINVENVKYNFTESKHFNIDHLAKMMAENKLDLLNDIGIEVKDINSTPKSDIIQLVNKNKSNLAVLEDKLNGIDNEVKTSHKMKM